MTMTGMQYTEGCTLIAAFALEPLTDASFQKHQGLLVCV